MNAKLPSAERRTKAEPAKRVLGPFDHDRPMSLADFDRAECRVDWRAELIDGRVQMSPAPEHPHDFVNHWLYNALNGYWAAHPGVLKYVTMRSRVYVRGRRKSTCPEPDVAAYGDYPFHLPLFKRTWKTMTPLLVAEVLSEDANKDLKRNVALYAQVPSIREYWVVDPLAERDDEFLRAFRRHGEGWQKPLHFRLGETYETKLLPGFRLLLDYGAR